ncbi:MAG: hypothetical protein R3184_10245, partial [Aurantimonas coralicida]|nr:hypothetical protein [Aurantimonas coralicida]
SNDLNLFGLSQTVNGAPDPDWFYATGTNQMRVLPMDMVWGMLNASCVAPKGQTGLCETYEGSQFAPPGRTVPSAPTGAASDTPAR